MPTNNNNTTAKKNSLLIAKKKQQRHPLPLPSRAELQPPQQPQRALQPPLPSRAPQALAQQLMQQQQAPPPPQPQLQQPPPLPRQKLRLQDVSADDRLQMRSDTVVLADVESQIIALLHAPPRGNNNNNNLSNERRRELIGHAVLTALPLMAKVAGLARATKTYHEDALPSDLVACRDRLDSIGLHTTRAFAYMEDLVECQALGDAILRAAGTPLL
jgi:hypothetical protein